MVNTWSDKTTGISAYIKHVYSIYFLNKNIGFASGTVETSSTTNNLHILKTTDGGTTWIATKSLTGDGTLNYIKDLYVLNENEQFACGMGGYIYKGVNAYNSEYYQPGIGIDQNGKAHVAYWGWSNAFHSDRNVYYTNNLTGNWKAEQLIKSSSYMPQTDGQSKIAFDFKTNTLFIGALASGNGQIHYTRDINIRKATLHETKTTVTSSTTLTEPTTIDLTKNDTINALAVLDFKVNDIAGDALPTKITHFNIRRGPKSTNMNYSQKLGGAYLLNNGNRIYADSIGEGIIGFGHKTPMLISVNDGTTQTFTLYTWLKTQNITHDGDSLDFKISAAHDVYIDTTGTWMTIEPSDVTSGLIRIKVQPTHFSFTDLPNVILKNSDFTFETSFKVIAKDENDLTCYTASCTNLTLSAVGLDSISAINGTMTSTPTGNQTLSSGEKVYTKLIFTNGQQYVRIKASGTVNGIPMVSYSEPVKIIPFNDFLVYKNHRN